MRKAEPLNNKRPMGHIAHLRNQYKSMNTFDRSSDYIDYKTGPVVQCKKVWPFHLNKTNPLYPMILFAKFG